MRVRQSPSLLDGRKASHRGETARYRDVFAVAEFRALWAAQVLSVGGDQLARVALTVLVYAHTGSALLAAAAYAASIAPQFLGGLLLSGLAPQARKEILASLAERDPEAAAQFEARVVRAGQQGFATSEEEIHQGVWAASAAIVQGKRTLAVLTVPSPLVRAPAEDRKRLLDQVRAAAARLNAELRVVRR